MIKLGPLYEKRKNIVNFLKSLPVHTGDIVFNAADVPGPFNIPFSKLIQRFTNSTYSHATVLLVENDEIYAIDVSDWGTRKLRLIDWFDNWYMEDFCIYRLRNKSHDDDLCLTNHIYAFLDLDPSYDFNFNDPSKFYCTESVKTIYKECGYDLGGAYLLKDIVPNWFYPFVYIGNYITSFFSKASLPTNLPISIVGNHEKGMMASPLIQRILTYPVK